MHEQRKYVRVPLRIEVSWESKATRNQALTSDISMGGCYVESLDDVTVGDTLCFDFRLSDRQILRLSGQVLYQHPTIGFGVRFEDLNLFQRLMLKRLIEQELIDRSAGDIWPLPETITKAVMLNS